MALRVAYNRSLYRLLLYRYHANCGLSQPVVGRAATVEAQQGFSSRLHSYSIENTLRQSIKSYFTSVVGRSDYISTGTGDGDDSDGVSCNNSSNSDYDSAGVSRDGDGNVNCEVWEDSNIRMNDDGVRSNDDSSDSDISDGDSSDSDSSDGDSSDSDSSDGDSSDGDSSDGDSSDGDSSDGDSSDGDSSDSDSDGGIDSDTEDPYVSKRSGEDERTFDLSHRSWSEGDGIVIFPERDFHPQDKNKTMQEELKEDITSSEQPKVYDLNKLLYDIQKSRTQESTQEKEKRLTMMDVKELVDFLKEQNAKDVCVIELPLELEYVKYFITCTGMGSRHIGRIADSLESELKQVRIGSKLRRIRVEGKQSDDWKAIDLGTMVVHVMLEESRERYELEKLWTLGVDYDDQYRHLLEFVDSDV